MGTTQGEFSVQKTFPKVALGSTSRPLPSMGCAAAGPQLMQSSTIPSAMAEIPMDQSLINTMLKALEKSFLIYCKPT